jgi:hemerythrin-like domain-containing protein
MAEHRMILKMIGRMREQAAQMEALQTVNGAFVDSAVDFMRNYAGRCHHAKEESIFFHDMAKKPLPGPMRQTLGELLDAHAQMRSHVEDLAADRQEHIAGRPDAWRKITGHMRALVALVPAHIREEEEQFFNPSMDILSPREQEEMIEKFHEADRRQIHEHYARAVCTWLPAGAPAK